MSELFVENGRALRYVDIRPVLAICARRLIILRGLVPRKMPLRCAATTNFAALLYGCCVGAHVLGTRTTCAGSR